MERYQPASILIGRMAERQ